MSVPRDPHCMQCRKPWTAAQLRACGFTQQFINGPLRIARESQLWDREQSLLPAAQEYVQSKKYVETVLRPAYHDAVRAMNAANATLQDAEADLARLAAAAGGVVGGAGAHGGKGQAAPAYLQRCPVGDCLGFVARHTGQCGLCAMVLCTKCRVVLSSGDGGKVPVDSAAAGVIADHVCDETTVAEVAAMATNTKPCPSCAAPIFRVAGCDQMFCTICHTAFSWSRGTIEKTTTIHNPHYFEWLRQRGSDAGRDAGAAACGRLRLQNEWVRWYPDGSRLETIHQMVVHLEHTTLYRPDAITEARTQVAVLNFEDRTRYLSKKLDAAEYKRRLFLRERALARHQDMHNIMQVLLTVLKDIFHRMANAKPAHLKYGTKSWANQKHYTEAERRNILAGIAVLQDFVKPYVEEMHAIRKHVNTCWEEISMREHIGAPFISPEWKNNLKHRYGAHAKVAGKAASHAESDEAEAETA